MNKPDLYSDGDIAFERSENDIKPRSKIFSHLSASLLAIVFVFALAQVELQGLRGILIDGLFRTQWWTTAHPDIQLIAYNDESAARYDGSSKIPAEEISRVFDALASQEPLAVALITPINEKIYSDTELSLIAKSFAKIPNTYVGYTDNESLGKNAPPALLHSAHYLPGYVSRDTFSYGADSVSRRVMLNIEGIPTLYSKLAALYHTAYPASENEAAKKAVEKFGDSQQIYINWQGPAGTYQSHSSLAVSQRFIPQGTFKNKIVLFSTVLQAKKDGDYIFTPYSREHFGTSLLEGAAHSLVTAIRDNGIHKSSTLINTLLALLVALATVNMVLFLPPGKGIFFVLFEVALLFGGAWISLFSYQYWINIAHPLVIICVGYYLVIPYRLVDEYRKRWHYQEKSELMAQLEQLKSNFLSLISHDLKTPIARIQGNAELALSESGTQMTEKQQKSLQAIIHTTEDLGAYVETILDLTRIESARVPLHKTSKDINAVVREVVASKQFLATDKNITIETQLEPLFSFKFDVRLMKQVLANLLENAIKYSPPDTTISLSTKEEGNWVRVAIADQGYGISADEQRKVFTKFYRSSNEKTNAEKGTGLGLYLVKYFVELHKGIVDLKSELGSGSVFTVSLPV